MSEGTPAPEGGTPEGTPDAGTPTTPDTPDTDLTAEVEKWKALSKKNEDRAKQNAQAAKELDEVRKQSMTEQEKAVAEARTVARAEAFREAGGRLVDAEVKAAAKGRIGDVDALLEGLDRSKFLNDDGEPDLEAINKWIDRLAPEDGDTPAPSAFPDIGQGNRSTPPALGSDPLLNALKRSVGA